MRYDQVDDETTGRVISGENALEMLARAQFATGSKTEALATAREAVQVCKNADDPKDLQQMIALYEKAQ